MRNKVDWRNYLLFKTTYISWLVHQISGCIKFCWRTKMIYDGTLNPRGLMKYHFVSNEPPHDKTNKRHVRPAKTQISLGISESSLCAQWVAKGPKLSACGHRRLWSHWADAQADLSLRWAHMPFCWFCHEAAQMCLRIQSDLHVKYWFSEYRLHDLKYKQTWNYSNPKNDLQVYMYRDSLTLKWETYFLFMDQIVFIWRCTINKIQQIWQMKRCWYFFLWQRRTKVRPRPNNC